MAVPEVQDLVCSDDQPAAFAFEHARSDGQTLFTELAMAHPVEVGLEIPETVK